MGQPQNPFLYQLYTRILLRELSRKFRRTARLKDIPNSILDQIANRGFDWVWMLGIWQTGDVGTEVARSLPDLRQSLEQVLPDLTDEDIQSSPFAVKRYVPHESFGGQTSLLRLRDRLKQRNLRLMLDFVPNHTAHDHIWAYLHPEYYIQGTEEDLARDPSTYCKRETYRGPKVFAHGKDPYFPAWTDTLQLNYRHAGLREAMIRMLLRIAENCDGVRCDMAMLILPRIIEQTWGERSAPADGSEPNDEPFWPEAIGRVRERHPEFVFMAEVYWDLEWELQQQGFDYTYDKRLYDRLRDQQAEPVRQHLVADLDFQRKLVRFIENHDEPRAAGTFSWEVHQAAALTALSLPGMRFVYEGQLEGRTAHVAMQLARRPDEKPNAEVQDFYRRLLKGLNRSVAREGEWQLLDTTVAGGGSNNAIVFLWQQNGTSLLAAVNYGSEPCEIRVKVPVEGWKGQSITLKDLMSDQTLEASGDEATDSGLTLSLQPWGYHLYVHGDRPEKEREEAPAEAPPAEELPSEEPSEGPAESEAREDSPEEAATE